MISSLLDQPGSSLEWSSVLCHVGENVEKVHQHVERRIKKHERQRGEHKRASVLPGASQEASAAVLPGAQGFRT